MLVLTTKTLRHEGCWALVAVDALCVFVSLWLIMLLGFGCGGCALCLCVFVVIYSLNHEDRKGKMMEYEPISDELERLAKACVEAAYKVHKALGPGLLESVYEACMAYELRKAGLHVDRQQELPIVYDGQELDEGLRLDLLVESKLIVELKAVEKMIPLFTAQTVTYLKLTKRRLALLINFNVPVIKDGIKRVVVG